MKRARGEKDEKELKEKEVDVMPRTTTAPPSAELNRLVQSETGYLEAKKSYLERASDELMELLLKDNGRVTTDEFLCLTPERIKANEKFAKENAQAD